MARFDNEYDRERNRERNRERDHGDEPERGRQEFGGQNYDYRENTPGGGSYGQPGMGGYGGGMGAYSGSRGQENWRGERQHGRERMEDREFDRGRDREREQYGNEHGGQGFSGREGGWGGYGAYDRERANFGGQGGYGESWERDYSRFEPQRSRMYPRDYGMSPGSGFGGGYGFGPSQWGAPADWQGSYSRPGGYYGQPSGGYGQVHDWYQPSGQGWGYSQNQERYGRHYGRGPKNWQRSDDRIREDVNERLTMHPDIDASEIEIEVHSGEVTLKGAVDDRRSKRMAEDVAESVSGVREVRNEIRVQQGMFGSEHSRERISSAGHSGSVQPSQQQTTKQPEMSGSKK